MLRSYDRKWTKPLVRADQQPLATATPRSSRSAFRTLGLGKLVGQPTGGFVIGTTQHRG